MHAGVLSRIGFCGSAQVLFNAAYARSVRLQGEDMHGLPDGELIVAPYDEQWPQLYEREAERIRAEIGDHILDIQHVGSTSVPGQTYHRHCHRR